MTLRPLPVLTVVVFVLTAVPSLLQGLLPGLEPALRRDPSAIAEGEWWRLGTSLVVQDGGWLGTLSNLAFLLILGTFAERTLGRVWWLALYLGGAVAGQAAGVLFGTVGAGNSVAVCGLAGGLIAAFARGRFPHSGRLEAATATLFALLLSATAIPTSLAAPIVAAVLGGLLLARREAVPGWVFLALTILIAVVLTAAQNLHGPALGAGLLIGALVRRVPTASLQPKEPV